MHGYCKIRSSGYVADTGDAGKYHGHLVPARLSRPYSYRQAGRWRRPLALLRLRIPDGVFQSLADDPETLCRRALGQALGAGLLRTVAVDGDYQEIRFELDAEPWGGPMQAARA